MREGLLALRSEGFVRQVPRRGFVVAPFTQQDIRDLFWAQSLLAGELAARAAKKITPEQLDRLDAMVKQYDVAIANDDKTAIDDLGHLFHREINLAADPRAALLVEQWDAADWSQLWWVKAQLHHVADPPQSVVDDLADRLSRAVPQYADKPFHRVLVCRVATVTGWAAASREF